MAHPAHNHQLSLQNVDRNCVPPCLKPSDGLTLLVAEASQVPKDLAPPTPLTSPGAILSHWPPLQLLEEPALSHLTTLALVGP